MSVTAMELVINAASGASMLFRHLC